MVADARHACGITARARERRDLLRKSRVRGVDFLADLAELFQGRGYGEVGRGSDQHATVAGGAERRCHFGHPPLVDRVLYVAHLVEREPPDEGRGEGEHHCSGEREVELG
ncbi:MAG: hypothetical protein F4Z96_04000 [Chloroflexi bacterium]|nr:hypothetical protein [Chloroflexota bacterium]